MLSHPAGDSGVTERLAHQVSQQGVGSQEAEPDVGGLGEIPQHRRVGEVQRPGTTVYQGHHNLREGGGHRLYQLMSRCGNRNMTVWESPVSLGGMTSTKSTMYIFTKWHK